MACDTTSPPRSKAKASISPSSPPSRVSSFRESATPKRPPACFRPGQGARSGQSDGAPVDDLAELVADGSVRLGQDIFLTEAEAKELERGKVPIRVQRAG
ncbi:MAG: hypothetical protein IPK71_16355 [Myxococcales bacterium]|nr:hypothetical protein [Myxococcales bacterium]